MNDVLVVYSDGVTEALNVSGEEFGEDRLAAVVAEHYAADATTILNAIVRAVQTFSHGAPQHDDVTAMVVKFTG
jgi:serine phosphatase RsbU (regulator of sigma subunit)